MRQAKTGIVRIQRPERRSHSDNIIRRSPVTCQQETSEQCFRTEQGHDAVFHLDNVAYRRLYRRLQGLL